MVRIRARDGAGRGKRDARPAAGPPARSGPAWSTLGV